MSYLTKRSVIGVLARFLVLAAVCVSGALAADPVVDAYRTTLGEVGVKIENDYSAEGGLGPILVVGESHPSVKSQIQIADLIGKLRAQQSCDVVFVEGSSGPLSAADIVLPEAGNARWKTDAAYWRPQLEWGQISGYEFAKLVDRRLPVVGVEDMAAKARFELEHIDLPESALQETAAMYRKAYAVLAAATKDIGETPDVQTALRQYRDQLDSVDDEIKDFAKQAKTLVSNGKVLITERAKIQQTLEKAGADLSDEKSVQEVFNKLGFNDKLTLVAAIQRMQTAEEEMKSTSERVEPLAESIAEMFKDLHDKHFRIANRLIQAAGEENTEVANRIRAFFAEDMRDRKQISKVTIGVEELAERDKAMVANVVSQLREREADSAVFIIGYAHMEGITAELRREKCSFVAAVPPASLEDIAPWEMYAWEERRSAYVPRFNQQLRRQLDDKIKELSRLARPEWRQDQQARAEVIGRAQSDSPTFSGMAGRGTAYEGIVGPETVMRVSSLELLKNVAPREYVRSRGVFPGRPGEYYELYDRKRGKETADSSSDGENLFVYQTVTSESGSVRVKYHADGKDRPFAEFGTDGGGGRGAQPPRRIVLFGEPDAREGGGDLDSPSWRRLRGGGGGGQVPPGKGWADPRNPRRGPQLLRTLNPDRAKRNAAALGRQRPSESQKPILVQGDDLGNLHQRLLFTPESGENSQLVTIVAKNTTEFRKAIAEASAARLLENKQVALVTCGDQFVETTELRELLLESGAVSVWTPSRQISESQGREFGEKIRETWGNMPAEERIELENVINRALREMWDTNPNDSVLPLLLDSGTWVEVLRRPDYSYS